METDTKSEELRLLYECSVSEIAGFKQQQWHVTNYALLLDAALVSIAALMENLSGFEYLALLLGALLTLWIAWYLIGVLDESIRVRRERLTEARKHFSDEFMNAWRCGRDKSEIPDNPELKVTLRWLFRYVLSLACLASCWLLIRYATA